MARGRLRVVVAHEASFPYSMRVKAGDRVSVGQEDDEMPGWLWCTDSDGVGAWVPDIYLERENGEGRMLVDYDSTEFTVEEGDILESIKESNGWIWCTNANGVYGWVPAEKVQAI